MEQQSWPVWYESYRAALFEVRPDRLESKIAIAWDVLTRRLQEINVNDVEQRWERDRILQAFHMLELLKHVCRAESSAARVADAFGRHPVRAIDSSANAA